MEIQLGKLSRAVALGVSVLAVSWSTQASTNDEVLVQLAPTVSQAKAISALKTQGKVEPLVGGWVVVKTASGISTQSVISALQNSAMVAKVQPNYRVHLLNDYKVTDVNVRAKLKKIFDEGGMPGMPGKAPADNPAIPDAPRQNSGPDPEFSKQWGMNDIGVRDAWKITKGDRKMIVAVIDTGVDYTHPDLIANMWRNPGEAGAKATNGVDDDGNGFIDDVVGWDFASNDNKPYDLTVDPFQMMFGGGNPGHGTHCAGNVAARGDNAKGIAGVAPMVKIMPLRFISEKGGGTTADAVKAIRYAVDNGAKIMSNSWGSEGEDPADGAENKALHDAVQYAQDHGVLFIAAAGNGHKGVGYDNDTDKLPAMPASYDNDIIISVAAIDKNDNLGAFSNWGAHSVDIGAPGVAVFSTMVSNNYSDIVIDKLGFKATWDGTSMATPHVAGAAALYWSAHPEKSWQQVKAAILGSAKKINALANKSVSGGKLDVKAMMNY